MITSPNGRVYIGSTKDFKNRFKYYKWGKCKAQRKLYNSFTHYGFENHKFEIIWEGQVEERLKYEFLIGTWYEVLDPIIGLNCVLPKYNDTLPFISEETREKMRQASTGKKMLEKTRLAINKANLGRPKPYKKHNLTQEQREKKRLAMVGNTYWKLSGGLFTEETKRKISYVNSLKIVSEEHKQKISDKNSIPILQYDLQGNFIREWKSAREVFKTFGWSYKNIQSVCAEKRPKANGYKWAYKKKE